MQLSKARPLPPTTRCTCKGAPRPCAPLGRAPLAPRNKHAMSRPRVECIRVDVGSKSDTGPCSGRRIRIGQPALGTSTSVATDLKSLAMSRFPDHSRELLRGGRRDPADTRPERADLRNRTRRLESSDRQAPPALGTRRHDCWRARRLCWPTSWRRRTRLRSRPSSKEERGRLRGRSRARSAPKRAAGRRHGFLGGRMMGGNGNPKQQKFGSRRRPMRRGYLRPSSTNSWATTLSDF